MCAERVRPGLALIPAMLVGLASGCAQPLAPTSTTQPGAVVPIDQRAALADAERRWASWRLQNYDFLAYSPCFPCRLPSRVRVKLIVHDDVGQDLAFASEVRIAMFQALDFSTQH